VAVADADVDPAQWRGGRAEVGEPGVVLVARQGRKADLRVGFDEDLPDDAGLGPPGGGGVDEAEAGPGGAVGPEEGVAEDLEPGADAEDGGAAVDRPVDGAFGDEGGGGRCLGAVLPAAENVDVARRRRRFAPRRL